MRRTGPAQRLLRKQKGSELRSLFANHVWRISVDADVLSDLVRGIEIGDSLDDPALRIGPWILNRKFDFQVAQICAVQAFSDVQPFRVRMTNGVKPRQIIEAHR